ncbi:MAG TPA: hypothetical protein VG603_11435, partial [Chitinophagales bacterium]|nr:hypothetical protein [Chitinophagales bacterium]
MKKILALTVTVLVTGFAGYNTVSGQTNDNTDTGKKSSAKEKPQHVASSYDDFNSMVASFKEKRRIELKTADKFYAESYYYTAANYYRDVLRQDTSN